MYLYIDRAWQMPTRGRIPYNGDGRQREMEAIGHICLTTARRRERKKHMTNADKIRAMSDEELADIFLRADFCKCCEHEKDGVCNYICAYPNIPLYEGCKQAALRWMKQPAEEDT